MNVVLIGIGQYLRGDDGAGPEAVRRWSAEFPAAAQDPRLQILLLETPGLGLLPDLESADAAVLVDAVAAGLPPGSVRVFDPIPEAGLTPAEKTAHGFGVAEAVSVARRTGLQLPPRLVLIGIEGEKYELGTGLSHSVSTSLSWAVRTIQSTILELLSAKNTNGA
ncbi:MAG: hydrogenase maturation protease [Anaerolineales bacterium]|nr:hydrogenase maturation protease [Anaerolineales bacterium]